MTENDREPLVFSPDEARKLLKLSRGLVYAAIGTGQIPSIRIGRRILIPRSGLERLLNNVRDTHFREGNNPNGKS